MTRSSPAPLHSGAVGPYPAENILDAAVRAGDVPTQYTRFVGKRYVLEGEDYYEPWIEDLPSLADAWEHGRIHTRLSSIYLIVPDKGFGTFYRIEAGLEAVRKLLPEGYELPASATTPASNASAEPASGGSRSGRKLLPVWDALQMRAEHLLVTVPTLRRIAEDLTNRLRSGAGIVSGRRPSLPSKPYVRSCQSGSGTGTRRSDRFDTNQFCRVALGCSAESLLSVR